MALALVIPAHAVGLWLAKAARQEPPLVTRVLRVFSAELSINPVSNWTLRLGTRTVVGSFVADAVAAARPALRGNTRPAVHLLPVLTQRVDPSSLPCAVEGSENCARRAAVCRRRSDARRSG